MKTMKDYLFLKPLRFRMTKGVGAIFCVIVVILFMVSCSKDTSAVNTDAQTATSTSGTGSLQVIAVSTSTTSKDSVYLVHSCANGQRPDSVAFANLPSSITGYLATNYNGY